jgi:predicted nucleotidyltransferase component of viral defense system
MTPKDIAASIRARLLNLSREAQEDFQMLLNRYARERLLYRLSQSPHRDRFVLKGATLFSVWVEKPFRSTRDADFLSFGPNDVDSVTRVFRDLCGSGGGNDPDDGVLFDAESIRGSQIREDEEYSGVRILLDALLGKAKARIQVDIGFGDAITPEAQEVELPVLLNLPAPRLRAYPKETVIAEKFQAMAVLAETNSRMKDFYDIWVMQSQFTFEGAQLAEAIKATFARRRTDVVPSSCVAFQSAFYASEEPLIRWRLYVQRGSFERIPPPFAEVGEAIDAFLRPVAESIARNEEFDLSWPAGGPWKRKEE